jgi:hypothetical protein
VLKLTFLQANNSRLAKSKPLETSIEEGLLTTVGTPQQKIQGG